MSTLRVLQPIPDDIPDLPTVQAGHREPTISREGVARTLRPRRREGTPDIRDLIADIREGLEGCKKNLLETMGQIEGIGIQEELDNASYEIAAKLSAISSTRDLANRYDDIHRTWTDLNTQFCEFFDDMGVFLGESSPGSVKRLMEEIDTLWVQEETLYKDVMSLRVSIRANTGQGIRMRSLSRLDRDIFVDPMLFLPSRYQRVHPSEDEVRKMVQDADRGRGLYCEDE